MELHDQCIAACNGKPPWSTNALIHTGHTIEHHDIAGCGIPAIEYCDKGTRNFTNQAFNTFEEAPGAYMVAVIAESHF